MSQVTQDKVVSAPVPMTPMQEFWHYFKRNKGAVVGLVYVVVVLIIAIFANWIAPYNPADQFRDSLLSPPVWQDGGSWAHILGTDDVGRDVMSRLMYGARLSLLVGCLVVVLSLIMGVVLGLVAGYFGGLVDNIIMRVVDIMHDDVINEAEPAAGAGAGGYLRPVNRQRLAGADLRGAAALRALNACRRAG